MNRGRNKQGLEIAQYVCFSLPSDKRFQDALSSASLRPQCPVENKVGVRSLILALSYFYDANNLRQEPLQIEYDGTLYHVTSLGNEKKSIFRDEISCKFFLTLYNKQDLKMMRCQNTKPDSMPPTNTPN